MQKKTLDQLLIDLEKELLRLGYSQGTRTFYHRKWKKLLEFAKIHDQIYYSEKLGLDFLEVNYQILEKDFEKVLCQKDTQEIRVIRMVGDFQLHNTILRRYYKHKELLTDPYYIGIRRDFKDYCIDKDYSEVTVEHYTKQSGKFMDYLVSQGITQCEDINQTLINNYIKTLAGYTYKTIEQVICSLRAFLRFLSLNDIIKEDMASSTPMVHARKQTRIPSVWTKEELTKLIEAIDCNNPKGKRDYAIILLACCLGLRCSDIKNLTFDNFHWEDKKLEFIQSKTRTLLTLPLPNEVGWAVIDYIKYGRPDLDSQIVFLKHLAPHGPFKHGNHLSGMIKTYMQIAHLPTLKQRRGMHSLRHTAASFLLENETPLSVISDILGHLDTDSTGVYLKINIKQLKECPLNIMEVLNE